MDESTAPKYPRNCACMTVRKASRAITKLYDQALSSSGLKITQFSMLQNIKNHGPINISALAKLLTLDRTTLVRNLKPLEKAKLIESVPSSDPRERQVCITAQGLQTTEVALPQWKTVQRKLVKNIGIDQLIMLEDFANDMESLLEGD